MHTQLAALVRLGDGLDHRPENVGIDVAPVQISGIPEIPPGNGIKDRTIDRPGKQAAIHVCELVRPARQVHSLVCGPVHRLEGVGDGDMGLCALVARMIDDQPGELVLRENPDILGKQAEDQPRHELVELVAPFRSAPVRIKLEEGVIEPGQLAGGADIDFVLIRCLETRHARRRQEEAEMPVQLVEGAAQGLACRRVFRDHHLAIARDQDGWLVLEGFLVGAKEIDRGVHFAGYSRQEVELLVHQNTARQFRAIERALAGSQFGHRGWRIPGRRGEGEGKLVRVEGLSGNSLEGVSDFCWAHGWLC